MLLIGNPMARNTQSCGCEKIIFIISTIFAVKVSFIHAKPASPIPKLTLEKFYHEMIEKSSKSPQTFSKVAIVSKPNIKEELLRKIYEKKASIRGKRQAWIVSRTRIYSVSSRRYLSVYGSLVNANATKYSENAVILMETVGFGKIRLRGEKSRRYICFNRKGKLVGKSSPDHPDCVFRSHTSLPDHYTAFQSVTNPSFWIGVRPFMGLMKKGKRTAAGQRATKFIVIGL